MSRATSFASGRAVRARLATIALLLCGVLVSVPPAARANAKLIATDNVYFEIGGKFAGWAHEFSGGGLAGDQVLNHQVGPARMSQEPVAVEDVSVWFGLDMAPVWWEWIDEATGKNPGRTHDLTAVRVDAEGRQKSRMILRQARITEIVFPTFDGSSKYPILFRARMSAASAEPARPTAYMAPPRSTQRLLPQSNFRFELGDLPTQHAQRVQLPTVTIDFPEYSGASRKTQPPAPVANIGDMNFTIPIHVAGPILEWVGIFTQGRATADHLLPATLSILTPDIQHVVLRIYFDRVSGVKFVPLTGTEANAESVATSLVELRSERVRMIFAE